MPEGWAKTARVLSEVWATALEVPVQVYLAEDVANTQYISATGLGGIAVLENAGAGGTYDGGVRGVLAAGEPTPGPGPPPTECLYDLYYPFRLKLNVGVTPVYGTSVYYVHCGQARYTFPAMPPGVPGGGVICTSLSIPVTCTITGLTLCEKVTNAEYEDRTSPLDPTDRTKAETWFADEASEVTVAGDGVSATGGLTGAGGEVDLGSAFSWIAEVHNNNFPTADTTFGRLADVMVFGVSGELAATLYNPGAGDAPSSVYPDWKREAPESGAYLRLVDDGGIALQRSATSNGGGTGGCIRSAPYILNYKGELTRQFDPDGDAPSGLLVAAEPRSWVDDAWVQDTWTAGSDYSKTQFGRTELFPREWQFLSGSGIGQITQASRVAQGEDVGGSTIAQNDAQVLFVCQPLTAGVVGNPFWGPFLTVTHLASLNLNDPRGAATRPSLWTGGAGVTVDGGDNDAWTVAAGTGSPKVSRVLTNRYELRMARLAGGVGEGEEWNPDWPYVLRRNRAGETYATFNDDPDWWDSGAGGCDEEDVWNWDFAYLFIGLTAPKTGTVQLKLTVWVPWVFDPCFSSPGERYKGSGGAFSISYTEKVLTYRFAVTAGANGVTVDLCKPQEGIVPVGECRLCVVKQLEWTLPGAGGTDEAWTLSGLNLILDSE
jgi:hypothetical protein